MELKLSQGQEGGGGTKQCRTIIINLEAKINKFLTVVKKTKFLQIGFQLFLSGPNLKEMHNLKLPILTKIFELMLAAV